MASAEMASKMKEEMDSLKKEQESNRAKLQDEQSKKALRRVIDLESKLEQSVSSLKGLMKTELGQRQEDDALEKRLMA